MRYLFFLLTLLATRVDAQTTTRALNWKNIFGRPFVFSGQVKNDKPDGIGYADKVCTDPATDFCNRLSEIMTHARTNFEKIKTEENQEPEEVPSEGEVSLTVSLIHKASLKFPGAMLSSVSDGIRGPDTYEAYFGYSETEALATKKIDSMKTHLLKCLKGYKVQRESRSDYSGEYPVIYVFDEKRTDKMPAQHLKLLIAKKEIYIGRENKDVFKIYLYINGLRPL